VAKLRSCDPAGFRRTLPTGWLLVAKLDRRRSFITAFGEPFWQDERDARHRYETDRISLLILIFGNAADVASPYTDDAYYLTQHFVTGIVHPRYEIRAYVERGVDARYRVDSIEVLAPIAQATSGMRLRATNRRIALRRPWASTLLRCTKSVVNGPSSPASRLFLIRRLPFNTWTRKPGNRPHRSRVRAQTAVSAGEQRVSPATACAGAHGNVRRSAP
jgi:hypothetical protein